MGHEMTTEQIVATYYDAWRERRTSFEVRRQFIDGGTVCSIIDREMAIPGLGRMTSAELLEIEGGRIVRGELIYDAEALRTAMAAAQA
jgi:hypothetical protein